MSDLGRFLTAAHEAVDLADGILRANRDHAVAFKGDRDPVTETDLAIERAMRDSLHRATPEAGFLGEETGGSTDGLAWVLDPIDGTANFTHGVPLTAVSLALLDHGEPIIGTIAVHAEMSGTPPCGDRAQLEAETPSRPVPAPSFDRP